MGPLSQLATAISAGIIAAAAIPFFLIRAWSMAKAIIR